MTEQQEKTEALKEVEKPAFKSKKFLAWFIQQIVMASMAIVALRNQSDIGWALSSFLSGIVFMMGISTMWYLGKQAAVDTAVRGFAMVTQGVEKLTDKIPSKKEKSSE